jgi:hypothetical protein
MNADTSSAAQHDHARRLFGDLRSIAHGAPSAAAWRQLCDLAEDPIWTRTPELWREEVAPYLHDTLNAWPDALRFAPQRWGLAIAYAERSFVPLSLARRLTIAAHPISNRGAFRLSQCADLIHLTHLTLWLCDIGQEGARELAATPFLSKRLNTLDLRRNAVSDEGAVALITSPQLAALHHLSLQDNAIGDSAALRIAESPQLKRLRTLNLCDNVMTYQGLHALQNSPHAADTAIDLEGNHMDETLAARLIRPSALRQWMWEAVSRIDRLWTGGAPSAPHTDREDDDDAPK